MPTLQPDGSIDSNSTFLTLTNLTVDDSTWNSIEPLVTLTNLPLVDATPVTTQTFNDVDSDYNNFIALSNDLAEGPSSISCPDYAHDSILDTVGPLDFLFEA